MTLHDIVALKHSWASYNLIYLHAFNRAIALMCTYLHIMVIWSHVAASVWLPLAMPVPHQDTVPLLYDCDNGSIPSTKLPWRPHPGIYSRGPAAPHFSGSFIHEVTVPGEHGWSMEGGCPESTPLFHSCSSAPEGEAPVMLCPLCVSKNAFLFQAVPSSTIMLPQDTKHPDHKA